MQGSIALRNEVRAMAEQPAIEFIYVLQQSDTVEAVTTDLTLYFQKAFIYSMKAVVGGVPTVNGAPVIVGKSGLVAAITPDSVVVKGSIATVTKAAHGLRPGMSVTGAGFTPAGFNVLKPTFNVTANTFDLQLAADPGPVTVMGTFTRTQFLPDALAPTDLPIKYELPLGLKMRVADIIARGTATDGVLIQAW